MPQGNFASYFKSARSMGAGAMEGIGGRVAKGVTRRSCTW
jgi:hypothetical protein